MRIVIFLFSFLLFLGGLVLMGYSFETPGYELVMFAGGILMSSLAVVIPMHVLKWADR